MLLIWLTWSQSVVAQYWTWVFSTPFCFIMDWFKSLFHHFHWLQADWSAYTYTTIQTRSYAADRMMIDLSKCKRVYAKINLKEHYLPPFVPTSSIDFLHPNTSRLSYLYLHCLVNYATYKEKVTAAILLSAFNRPY